MNRFFIRLVKVRLINKRKGGLTKWDGCESNQSRKKTLPKKYTRLQFEVAKLTFSKQKEKVTLGMDMENKQFHRK